MTTPSGWKRASQMRQLLRRLPAGELRVDPEFCRQFAGDKWFATAQPEAVALPKSTQSVSSLLQFCHAQRIPVTARGAGHGYVGGCVPVRGGVVLSLGAMKKIREIHEDDFVAVVQPGVILKTLQDEVEARGLYYPPDPASRADCSVGGTIATNAGGPRCLKYGVTRDYVLGLEVVQANGTVVRVGGRTHKNKTGFDFTRFFVGSEGLLGIVTEATLKLIPLPPFRAALSIGFKNTRAAVHALRDILRAGFLPCALEVADEFTIRAAQRRTGSHLFDGCRAHLIVELDGQPASVRSELELVQRLVRRSDPTFVVAALGARQCEKIWQVRREFSYALRDTGLTKLNQDIVVPRGRLPDLFQFVKQLQKRHQLQLAAFGHAGDGNIHVNVMVDMNERGAKARAQAALDDLFGQVLAWDGVITGEHGIGLAKKRWWPLAAQAPLRALHRDIKQTLDPNGILNPGKFV